MSDSPYRLSQSHATLSSPYSQTTGILRDAYMSSPRGSMMGIQPVLSPRQERLPRKKVTFRESDSPSRSHESPHSNRQHSSPSNSQRSPSSTSNPARIPRSPSSLRSSYHFSPMSRRDRDASPINHFVLSSPNTSRNSNSMRHSMPSHHQQSNLRPTNDESALEQSTFPKPNFTSVMEHTSRIYDGQNFEESNDIDGSSSSKEYFRTDQIISTPAQNIDRSEWLQGEDTDRASFHMHSHNRHSIPLLPIPSDSPPQTFRSGGIHSRTYADQTPTRFSSRFQGDFDTPSPHLSGTGTLRSSLYQPPQTLFRQSPSAYVSAKTFISQARKTPKDASKSPRRPLDVVNTKAPRSIDDYLEEIETTKKMGINLIQGNTGYFSERYDFPSVTSATLATLRDIELSHSMSRSPQRERRPQSTSQQSIKSESPKKADFVPRLYCQSPEGHPKANYSSSPISSARSARFHFSSTASPSTYMPRTTGIPQRSE
ncbi:hypothetical protein BLNAU_15587 [Blattamonas nauphoetae]|uniref:Uncharacterized protein n=1 Tax=Blattamonas nauphoetae TaxID=2049346 RepID=A0ABQ9XDM7_9EUKA|nr:hypothetical protein BLNAU_15587 [Blattamonas nauphoetae]